MNEPIIQNGDEQRNSDVRDLLVDAFRVDCERAQTENAALTSRVEALEGSNALLRLVVSEALNVIRALTLERDRARETSRALRTAHPPSARAAA